MPTVFPYPSGPGSVDWLSALCCARSHTRRNDERALGHTLRRQGRAVLAQEPARFPEAVHNAFRQAVAHAGDERARAAALAGPAAALRRAGRVRGGTPPAARPLGTAR